MSLENVLLLKDISNYEFDFKDLFEKKDCIIWKNCKNLTIKINSKINKLIFNNCKNMMIICNFTISGIEYFKCKNIIQTISKDNKIYNLDIFDTYITLKIYKNTKLPKLITEKAKINIEYMD